MPLRPTPSPAGAGTGTRTSTGASPSAGKRFGREQTFTAAFAGPSVRSDTTRVAQVPSSAGILANFRRRGQNEEQEQEQEQGRLAQLPHAANAHATVLTHLTQLFGRAGLRARPEGYTTSEVLARFPLLEDEYAPIFREMLRRVATFRGGRWVGNG